MRSAAQSRIRVGISGWKSPPWRGVFYPHGLAHARELGFVAQHFPTVEVNGSFYSLLRPTTYERWYGETPHDFVFSVKGSRFITHMKRLAGVETPLANFFASGVLALRDKLGPILWQLPASFVFDGPRLERFFGCYRAPARRRDVSPSNTTSGSMGGASRGSTMTARFATSSSRAIRLLLRVMRRTFFERTTWRFALPTTPASGPPSSA